MGTATNDYKMSLRIAAATAGMAPAVENVNALLGEMNKEIGELVSKVQPGTGDGNRAADAKPADPYERLEALQRRIAEVNATKKRK